MANKVFLDANILLELSMGRARKAKVEENILSLPPEDILTVSILSVDILFYYVEKEKRDKTEAYAFVENYRIADMNPADYDWAKANDQGDFEDALQVACALRHGCKKFLTLDERLAAVHRKHISVKLVR